MSVVVLATGWNGDPWRRRLSELLPGQTIEIWPQADLAAARYAVAWAPPSGVLANFPGLKAVISLGAGVDHLLSDPKLPDVPIVRVIDSDLTARMSEWVCLHVLMHHRNMPLLMAQQRKAIWRSPRRQPAAHDVRVGILGMGVLGSDAARKLAALGFRTAGWSRSGRTVVDGVESFAGAGQLDAFLGRTDILVALVPLTPHTRGMLNARLFRLLAKDGRLGGAVLLNPGRGGLQVEADILSALDEGTLIGASLDVFEPEPLPKDNPLWKHPKVVISPHNAAVSDPGAVSRFIAAQIERMERGETPEGLVSRATGY